MWIVRLALRRPFTVATLCLAILLMGVLSATRMDVDIFPSINIPVVVVVWNYPGMSAEDMERRVTLVSERGFSTSVNGVSKIDSESINGLSIIRVYFEPDTDLGSAIAQISAASLSASRIMPPGMQPPVVLRFNASNVPVAQLTISGQGKSEQELFDYGLNFLRLKLFTISGLSTPAPYGGRQRQVTVDVDPTRATALGLSPDGVVNAVLAQNVILPAGKARLGTTDYDVLLNGSPDSAAAFNRLPIRVQNGATVFLGDVANVYDGFALQENLVRVNGQRATYLAILKKENASTLAVIDATRDMLPSLRAAAPDGIELKLDFDQSVFVRGAVRGVLREGLIAAALVATMVLVFVGSWRSTLVVCTSIPISILVGVIGLKLAGQTLNLMTLGGLALAIGMLVDDAVVEIENINRNRSQNKELTRAILDGARQIAIPALAATTTICIVFFPVVLLEGPAKYLFSPLALAVVFSMLASYLLSRTLVPAFSHLILAKEAAEPPASYEEGGDRKAKPEHADAQQTAEKTAEHAAAARPAANELSAGKPARHGRFERVDAFRRRAFERLNDAYARALAVAVARRRWTLAGAALFVLVSGCLFTVVGLDFFPEVDAGLLRMHFRAPPGTRIEETERLVDRVEQDVRKLVPAAELETINDNVGVPISYNLAFVPTDNVDGADAEILVGLKTKHRPSAEYRRRIRAVIARDFPGSELYFQPADIVSRVLSFGASSTIDVQVQGKDVAASLKLASRLRRELLRIPGAEDVRIAQVLNHPALQVDVDRERAADLGLSERDVASSLLTSLSSSSLTAPNFWIDPKSNVNYFVTVQTPIRQMESVADLLATPVAASSAGVLTTTDANTASGQVAPPLPAVPEPAEPVSAAYVGSFSQLTPTTNRAVVNHYTVQPVLDVECSVEDRDLGGVSSEIQHAIDGLGRLPKDTKVALLGQSATMYGSFKALGLGLVLAVLLVYLLLVTLFQSWLDPFIIMSTVPGALAGILWLLVMTGTTLNVESLMGAIMAVGIAVSNSILLVTFANEQRSADADVSAAEAALRAGRVRLRPVLMTALAMVLGMLPMALGMGEGGEQNAPLGRAVIGGLVVATGFTLFVVPSVYAALRRKTPNKGRRDREIAEADAQEEPS